MLEAGHERANFAIVAAAANAASPHHEPSVRVIDDGDVVLCDFGGTMAGYCSDITRMFVVGEPESEVHDAYAVLVEAQEAGVRAAVVGQTCEGVDAAARRVIADAGFGDYFVHRTGHGIGTEAHEDPYIVAGNDEPLAPGHAFSIEPGIYLPGRFGLRLEDIVVATDAGPERLNHAPRDLAIVG
jgi:Xaa-Pro aminopeptidase